MTTRVFDGILNFDDAYFDSRCVECNQHLSWDEDGEGFWSTEHCGLQYTMNVYTVLRAIERGVIKDANSGTIA